MQQRFLLDTGVLLGFVREASWAIRAWKELNLGDRQTIVFTSIICRGELLALAEKHGWERNKRTRLEEALDEFPSLEIDEEIVRAYALIDAWTHGKRVAAPNQTLPPKPAVPMAKNDLWIAASAHVSKSTLLSTDKDFCHLNEIWINFTYIDQVS